MDLLVDEHFQARRFTRYHKLAIHLLQLLHYRTHLLLLRRLILNHRLIHQILLRLVPIIVLVLQPEGIFIPRSSRTIIYLFFQPLCKSHTIGTSIRTNSRPQLVRLSDIFYRLLW